MDRAELEMRLAFDEEFRAKVLELRDAQQKMHDAEATLRLVRSHFHTRIRGLVKDVGLPVSTVARYVNLSTQTINVILKNGKQS